MRSWSTICSKFSLRFPRDGSAKKSIRFFLLKNRAFTIWEQRPYIFQFKNYRPITGTAKWMYQNLTLLPLISVDGEVHQLCIIVYDVTDTAVNKIKLEKANDQLQVLDQTDRLTGLNNRGHWELMLATDFIRYQRTKHPCSLVTFDIDLFKKVNDSCGHQAGDEVIREVAARLQSTMRKTDVAGRYGGEEFGVILIDSNNSQGFRFCERLRQAMKNAVVKFDDADIEFTISLGVSEMTEDVADYKQLLEQADKALYASKNAGRDRTTAYSAELDLVPMAGKTL